MAIDPNVYALSIQLSLDSTDAFQTLDNFAKSATDLENNISIAAQKSLDSITNIANNLNEQLTKAVVITADFSRASEKLGSQLSLAAGSIKDASTTQEDNLKDIEERLEYLEKIDKIQEHLEKSLENEYKTGEEYLSLIDKWVSTLESKNKVHEIEGQLVQQETDYVRAMDAQWEQVIHRNMRVNDVLLRIRATTTAIWGLIKLLDSETEHFVQTNYRAYGSQQDLTNATRELSAEFGIARKTAIETYKALADVKTPLEEIDKLANVIAMAERTTGVGVQTIAEYTRSLRVMGFDAVRTERHIARLTESMRKYGLSQHDVNSLMNSGGLEAYQMGQMFGGAADQIEKFQDSRVHMAGFLKELGMGAEASNEFHKWLSEDIGALSQFGALARMQIKNADDFQLAQIRAGIAIHSQLEALRELEKAGKITHDAFLARQAALAKAHFNGNIAAMAAIEAMGEEAKALKLLGNSVEDYGKVVESLEARQLSQWNEANKTLTKQLQILKDTIVGGLGPALQFVADGLMYIVMVINMGIKPIAVITAKFFDMLNWIEANIPVIGYLVTGLKILSGILVFVTTSLITAALALGTFATAFAGMSQLVTGAIGIITNVINVVVSMATAIGQSIRAIFTGVGQGLLALGNYVRPVIVPLMQLSFAVLLVGAGFWMMGNGIAAAAEHGWNAVGVLAAMTVGMVAMISALAVTAAIAAPLVPLIVWLAGAVLLLGAATYFTGLGIHYIGTAVEQLATYGLQAAAALPSLAYGISLIALAGLFGFAGIMLLSGALMALAAPIMLIGTGLTMLSTAVNSLNVDNMIPASQTLLQSSAYFLGAGIMLIAAAPLLAVGSGLILASSVALTVAAPFLLLASTLMIAGSVAMLAAGVGLAISGMMFLAAGAALVPSSVMLLSSAVILVAAAPLLAAAGVMIIPAAIALLTGGLLLSVGATAIYYSASLMQAGATALLGVGYAINTAMDVIYSAAMKTYQSGTQFVTGSMYMSLGAAMLLAASGAIFATSIAILFGIPVLVAAATAFGVASAIMLAGATTLNVSAILMMSASGLLVAGSTGIFYAASILMYANSMLLSIATGIGSTSIVFFGSMSLLLAASVMLSSAAMWLIPASVGIYVGMTWLESATNRFNKSIGDIDRVGRGMAKFAAAFMVLSQAPIGSIDDAVSAALDAMPYMNKLASELDKSAVKFEGAADRFVGPIDRIAASLGGLSAALANMGSQGIDLQNDMDNIGEMLERYTTLLENTSQRIEVAIAAKAKPAMARAREEGIDDSIRSEPITTVKVVNESDGEASRTSDFMVAMAQLILQMTQINSKLDSFAGNDSNTTIGEIRDMLDLYLPQMKNRSGALSNELNRWG